jgi:hypothetical protein
MPVTARLSKRFYDTFGDEIANDLVEWFNQVDATYRQELREHNDLNWGRVQARLTEMETRLRSEFHDELGDFRADLNWDRIEGRMTEMEARLRSEFHEGLSEFRADLNRIGGRMTEMETRLRSDMDVGLERLRGDLLKWMFLFWTGTALTVIGLVATVR